MRRRFVHGAVILTYHRVADLAHDPYNLAVSPAHFAQHVDYLKATCSVMRLVELGEALQKRDLPPRAVAITFDDGYVDVFKQAHPILKAAEAPATAFIPSGFVGGQTEFWSDRLKGLFYSPEALPRNLNLCVRGQSYRWDIPTSAGKDVVFWAIWKLVKPLHHDERVQVLDELADWAGQGPNCRKDSRPMTGDELSCLAQDGWEIGAHTITHAVLSCLSEDEQRREIIEGQEMLVNLLNRPVSTFAYPHGAAEDFTDQTVAILRESDFSLACTMIPGCPEPGDDLFRLKRCAVYNWPLDSFVRQLESFFIS